SRTMTPHAYRRFLATAREVSPPLHAVIRSIGRLEMPDRRRRGLPWFLARAIVGQQLSTLAARSIWQRLEIAVRANDSAVPAFFRAPSFPLLCLCGISSARITSLIAIGYAYEDGRLPVRRLARLSHAARADHLTQIWGIGQLTADMCSLFYFQAPDVWPEG